MSLLERLPATWQQRLSRPGRVDSQGLRLRYRGIFILPTPSGWGFAFMLLIMWLAAINYSNSMAFALAFLLAGLALVLMLHCFRNLLGLRVSALPPSPVFAGTPALFPLVLHNDSPRTRIGVTLLYEGEERNQADVPARGSSALLLAIPTAHRGRLRAPRLRLATSYPGGLVRAWSWLTLDFACLVYPQPEENAPEPQYAGAATATATADGGSSDDFSGLRDYRPGDTLHRIDWRSVARGLPPQTKLFDGGSGISLWLDWHELEGLGTEAKLSRLCRWVVDAEHAGHRYGLRLPHLELPPAHGEAHYHRCLQALALYPA